MRAFFKAYIALATQYTCAMHPEVIKDAPSTCPKCGAPLEPQSIDGIEEV